MAENFFMRVDEVAKELNVSHSYAYKLVKSLNEELKKLGCITIAGRVDRKFSTRSFMRRDLKEEGQVINCGGF